LLFAFFPLLQGLCVTEKVPVPLADHALEVGLQSKSFLVLSSEPARPDHRQKAEQNE
jgi:hypothetical protein